MGNILFISLIQIFRTKAPPKVYPRTNQGDRFHFRNEASKEKEEKKEKKKKMKHLSLCKFIVPVVEGRNTVQMQEKYSF